ncbi:hypothetical protein EJV44_17425 [Ancylobacter aquaticus]|nr:hypothetical protein EJV44_17425 [Ancylobacter aquaticus]
MKRGPLCALTARAAAWASRLPARKLGAALHDYTSGRSYLHAMTVGASRVDLEGWPAEPVAIEHAKAVREQIEHIESQTYKRRAPAPLRPHRGARTALGPISRRERAKTGRAAAATLSRWSEAILPAYLQGLGFDLLDNTALFRTRHGEPTAAGGRRWLPRPYNKDKLGKDFATIRAVAFGEAETRQLADMRRSGTVEAFAGGASPGSVSAKMANTLSASTRLQKTYAPIHIATVRQVDGAREIGRARIREQKDTESVTTPDRRVSRKTQDQL